jgi:hypothetical protein
MPIARAYEPALEGAWVGAALPRQGSARGGRRRARVHSLFRRALYLEIESLDYLCCLMGPEGAGIPNAIALSAAQDFRSWPSAPDARGLLDDEALVLCSGGALRDALRGPSREAAVRVELRGAARAARETPAAVATLGEAYDASVTELSRIQAELECDLSLPSLLDGKPAASAMGRALARAALALGAAARGGSEGLVSRSIGGLIGLGAGLTPSGDDFLCGFLFALASAAGGAAAAATASELKAAVEARASAAGDISGSFLRCAARGYFPRELNAAAAAIAAEDGVSAVASIRRLCGRGHSSGADAATGLLYGLSVFAPAIRRGPDTARSLLETACHC